MKEKDITICGHGSNTPSFKNMSDYLSGREAQVATNGKSKGLVCVVRFLKTEDQRKKFRDLYSTLIGRNLYSQDLRQYVYEPRNGKYYSDCSSSGCFTFDKCGISNVKLYNTAAMYNFGEKVDVDIVNGHISENDLPKLRVGDALLFRGNDSTRPLQIGHVEYIYELPAGEWTKHKDGRWSFRDPDGTLVRSEWRLVKHHWYYLGPDGYLLTGWQQINGEWYYLEEAGDYEGACWHEREDGIGSLERWFVE